MHLGGIARVHRGKFCIERLGAFRLQAGLQLLPDGGIHFFRRKANAVEQAGNVQPCAVSWVMVFPARVVKSATLNACSGARKPTRWCGTPCISSGVTLAVPTSSP